MREYHEQEVPADLAVRFEELSQKMVDVLRLSCQFEQGPQLTIQMMLLTIIRIGMKSNPDIVDKLRAAVEVAYAQAREEMS